MSKPPRLNELAAVRARLRGQRAGSGSKIKIRLAIEMEEERIGGPMPPGLTLAQRYARLYVHWVALGYLEDEIPSERQLRYFLTNN